MTSDTDSLFSVSLSAVHPNDDGFLVVSDGLVPVYTPLGKETELLGESTSLHGLMGPVCLFSEPLSSSAVQQLSSTSKTAVTVLPMCWAVAPSSSLKWLHIRTCSSHMYATMECPCLYACSSSVACLLGIPTYVTFDQFNTGTCVFVDVQ